MGGTKSEKGAEVIGRDVAKSGYSIKTGGYAAGAMKGGLIGGAEGLALKEKSDFKQKIEGVTSADFSPIESATKGKDIEIEVAEDPYDRLKSLIRGSDIVVITEGSIGTELETYASFAFEIELEILNSGRSSKPIIFVGEHVKEKIVSIPKFAEYIDKSENIIFVNTPEEAIDQVDILFGKIKDKKRREVDM